MPLERAAAPRCNIGVEEIARRKRTAIAVSAVFAILALVTIVVGAPLIPRLLLWPVATAVGVTWLQVGNRFCVAFGALGLENFGRLGKQVPVADAQRAVDRRKALQLIAEGALIGLAVTLALIPLRL